MQDTTVPARGKGLVKTDLQIRVPHGTYGRVAPRSGLAWKQHIDIGAGVVDEDYRGNVGEVISGISTNSFKRGYYRCRDVQPRGHRVRGEEGRQNRPAGL